MTAPTEAEIRELIAARNVRYPGDHMERGLTESIDKVFDTIGYVDVDEEHRADFGDFLSDTWADLRPTEADHLRATIVAAKKLAFEAAREAIIQGAVDAALAFADEYPDAPRAPLAVGVA